MPFCNACGGTNPDHAKFCGHCGARQTGLDDPTFTSASTPSQPAPIPLTFDSEVASFREELRSLLETLKAHEKVEYLLNQVEEVAVEFSILGGRVPSEKIRLFWDIFAPMDPTIADMDLKTVGRYLKGYLAGPGARMPGVIEEPICLDSLRAADVDERTNHAEQYACLLYRLADLVCRVDGRVDSNERTALAKLRTIVEATRPTWTVAKLHRALGTLGADQAGPLDPSDFVAEVDAFKGEPPNRLVPTVEASFQTAAEMTFNAAEEDFASPYVQLSSITARRLDKDYDADRYSNSVLISPIFRNIGSSTIVGLRGHLSVTDGFGEEVFGFTFRADDKILPGHESRRGAGYNFEENQYEDDNPYIKIVPLIDAGTAKYTVRITKIAFEDGTILPKQ